MSRRKVTLAWWSICSAMYYLFLGAVLARSYGAINALVGSVLGAVALGFFARPFVYRALETGSGSAALSRDMLGEKGGSLPTLILFASCVYYAVFEGSVLAVTATKVIPGLSYGSAAVLVTLMGAGIAATKIRGFFERISGLLLPIYLAGVGLLVTLPWIRNGSLSTAWVHLGPDVGLNLSGVMSCLLSYLGLLGFCMISMDFACEGRTNDKVFLGWITFGVPFYFVTLSLTAVIGMLLLGELPPAVSTTETALVDAALSILGGVVGFGWLIATQTRINSANFHVASTNLRAGLAGILGLRLGPALSALIVGIIVLVLMRSTDVFSYILAALRWQGVLLSAWVGMAAVHISLRRIAPSLTTRTSEPKVRWTGVLAWITGVAAGLLPLYAGEQAAPWSLPVTVIVAASVHGIILRVRREPGV